MVLAIQLISLNSAGLPVGFDISVICALAQVLGYSDIQFVCTLDTEANPAIMAGKINAAICIFEATTPTASIATVQYQNAGYVLNGVTLPALGIRVSATCCSLIQNLTAGVAFLEANGTLSELRNEFGITPNTPVVANPAFIPMACQSTVPALPVRNAIGLFILNKYCLSICDNSNYVPC